MRKLLFDIGNSRLKWSVLEDGAMRAQQGRAHAAMSDADLVALMEELRCQKLYLSNVAGIQMEQQIYACAGDAGISEVHLIHTEKQAFGVTNAYAEPLRLGVDRWLAMVAARNLFPQPLFIVDAGSAITIDALDAYGQHEGGLIAPGFNNMINALVQNTNLVSESMTRPSRLELQNNTQEAMVTGCMAAITGMIMDRVPVETRLIVTGGDASWIAEMLERKCELIDDLVLRGVAIYAEAF